jgi:hypothetical protein
MKNPEFIIAELAAEIARMIDRWRQSLPDEMDFEQAEALLVYELTKALEGGFIAGLIEPGEGNHLCDAYEKAMDEVIERPDVKCAMDELDALEERSKSGLQS